MFLLLIFFYLSKYLFLKIVHCDSILSIILSIGSQDYFINSAKSDPTLTDDLARTGGIVMRAATINIKVWGRGDYMMVSSIMACVELEWED